MAEKWTKTSSPDWRWMNPKPLLALNHFTVPCSLTDVLPSFELFATSRPPPVVKQKGPQVSLQPLLSIPKVLQEQQTQYKYNTFTGPTLTNYSPRKSLD